MYLSEMLHRAKACSTKGRILQAQHLYAQVTPTLEQRLIYSTSEERRLYNRHIELAEKLEKAIKKRIGKSAHLRTILIENNSMGQRFRNLFGPFLAKDVKEIIIEEPYLRKHYQFRNLVNFLELAVNQCPGLEYVGVTTVPDDKKTGMQMKALCEVQAAMTRAGVHFEFHMTKFHDRKILLNTGYIFHLGVGINIYKPLKSEYDLGMSEFDFRKCRKTSVRIDQTKAFVRGRDWKCCIM